MAERVFKHSFTNTAVFTSILFEANNKGALQAFFFIRSLLCKHFFQTNVRAFTNISVHITEIFQVFYSQQISEEHSEHFFSHKNQRGFSSTLSQRDATEGSEAFFSKHTSEGYYQDFCICNVRQGYISFK